MCQQFCGFLPADIKIHIRIVCLQISGFQAHA